MQQPRMIAADRMNQAPSPRAERASNDSSEFRVVLAADMLEHADGCEHVVVTGYVAVIILDEFNPIVQALLSSSLAGVGHLLTGNIERPDPGAVAAGHMQCQTTPATTGLDNGISRLELQLAAYMVHLRYLGLLQAGFRRRGR